MMTAEYVLELNNVFHSGQVEPGTCLQKLIGSVRTGVILKVGIGKYPYMFSYKYFFILIKYFLIFFVFSKCIIQLFFFN